MRRLNTRTSRGSVLIESVVAIALMVPLTVMTVLVALEGSRAFVISGGMTEAAASACRALAREYKTNRTIVTDSAAQQAIFSNIRIVNMVHSNSQFEIEEWNLAEVPRTVTVRVKYISGAGTPALSQFPGTGMLNLGSAFQISQTATNRLQE